MCTRACVGPWLLKLGEKESKVQAAVTKVHKTSEQYFEDKARGDEQSKKVRPKKRSEQRMDLRARVVIYHFREIARRG